MARHTSLVAALVGVIAAPILLLLAAHRFAGGAEGLKPGDELPASRLMSLDGRPVDTGSWRGIPTLLVLYRSTCRACEQEIEGLTQVVPALPRLRVVLLSLDSAAPRAATGFPTLCDPSGQFVKKLRKLMVPTIYLVNERGVVVHVHTGRLNPQTELAIFSRLLDPERL